MKEARVQPLGQGIKSPMLPSKVKKKIFFYKIRILSYNKDFCHLQNVTAAI